MALDQFSPNARDAMVNALVDLMDVGAGTSGDIRFVEADNTTEVALIDDASSATNPLSSPVFGSSSGGVAAVTLTAGKVRDDAATATGTAAFAHFRDQDNNVVFRATVGTSGADINFNTVTWNLGDPVELTGFTVTAPS